MTRKLAVALSPDQLRSMLRTMHMIRQFDLRALDLYREGAMRGSTHPYIGMEAVAVGACAALRPADRITSTHRGHGHCLAKGGDPRLMMAELLGKATGYCKGKGGSMHIADVEAGILGANGIVGGGIGLATGAALAAQLAGRDDVTLCFFGDGALNQGVLHESANLAAIWKLPVVYICENNQYAMSARADRFTSVPDPEVRAKAYGFPGVSCDGMDVMAVYRTVADAVARARAGEGPSLVVCVTYRYFGHHVGDPLNYRDKAEVDAWKTKDPIDRFQRDLIAHRVLTSDEADRLAAAVAQEIDAAVAFAKASPEPEADALMEDVYA
ncbi:MAG: thiamine pyrophosphate-dependent dehydrogenase E1 component subunit alpha [Bacillati bacterium ANGP1]|uniref:Thiamine pyrophosphate-dependent dehydrogenase E1 component subunit alpha n=1 Tax=Candidatus Segetimicrobium genomatis TaxID=2569760 RepID=A0A537KAK4_9BACT|nr:MAG: thiamine pyrophosphate-dependent dehydrogenase E1 component subunit alpha [Terrabacteria group bacterium ANGP1]